MQKQCELEDQRIEMLNSLLEAVEKAGGNYDWWFNAVIEKQCTVTYLIDFLAQNNIRFVYTGDRK